MTKYDGIKVVKTSESASTLCKVKAADENKGTSSSGFWLRIFFSALIVGGLFFAKTLDNPMAQNAVAQVRQAVVYDINERDSEDLGEIKFVRLIKEFFDKKVSEKE